MSKLSSRKLFSTKWKQARLKHFVQPEANAHKLNDKFPFVKPQDRFKISINRYIHLQETMKSLLKLLKFWHPASDQKPSASSPKTTWVRGLEGRQGNAFLCYKVRWYFTWVFTSPDCSFLISVCKANALQMYIYPTFSYDFSFPGLTSS